MLKRTEFIVFAAAVSTYGQSTGTITGRVVSEGTPDSLHAAVTIVSADAGVRLRTVEADGSGVFSFDAPVGTILVTARAEGHVSAQREISVREGQRNTSLTFSLARAGSVSGRVVDLTGAGVAGARVWLHYPGEASVWRLAEEIGGEPVDEFGNFNIPMVAQHRRFVLHVEKEDLLPSASRAMVLRAPHLSGVLLLLSRRGSSVSGRVLDSGGRPVVGALVELRAIPADNEFTADQRQSPAFSRTLQRRAVSGAEGSYSFAGVPAGRIIITAHQQQRRAGAEAEIILQSAHHVDLLFP